MSRMNKGVLFLAVTLMIGMAPVAEATFVAVGLMNTGYDNAGNLLSENAITGIDGNYALISAPTGVSGPNAYIYDESGGFPVTTHWLKDNATPVGYGDSRWIAPTPPTSKTAPAGTYEFKTTFNLNADDLNSVIIYGKWSTDNTGPKIFLNNTEIAATSTHFSVWSDFTLANHFVQGLNTLRFEVFNTPGQGSNPAGLRVAFKAGEGGELVPVPEPISMVMLGCLGAGMFGARKLRRKESK